MDVLADLLDGVRARGAVFSRAALRSPWSLRFAARAPLTVGAVLRGEAWITPHGGTPTPVRAGDLAVVRGRQPFTLADGPRPASLTRVVGRDAYCGWNADDGPAVLVSGAFEGAVGERLLKALPEVLVVSDADCPTPLLDAVAAEVAADRPGGRVVLDRLLDLVLVSALRAWFDRTDAPTWYRATADPVVGRALELLHENPAHPWTVAGLAARCGVSRAGLARRFTAETGEPPMTYLAGWRVELAADRLARTDRTVGAIAREVGYANTFALSVAFKRLRGVAPSAHRASVRAAAVG
ncbi:AraC-like DNA-binding protein [Saccharothrix tamanrassetensis]|uniref:AraC-like DNA-binding protein n=1 Tax=Saccharothrix tamanrassetensis TaxID=1051531 RepID=A0A841CLV5_9PSEU|nr:AraC family transcriptional regulator [Saccharothrix tamanrassetensis]MBB5957923.1 AraC-like DNA-binding protein [Saccharothrix tamanrassetensis]